MIVNQEATATVTNTQEVTQTNNNQQTAAIADAQNGGNASVQQINHQTNSKEQVGIASARNVVCKDYSGSNVNQKSEAAVEHQQNASQQNDNGQEEARATASGVGSTATVMQQSEQTNSDSQVGISEAENVLGDSCKSPIVNSIVDDTKRKLKSNGKKNESRRIVNSEAVIAINGIRLVVTISEDRQTIQIQADRNGVNILNESRKVSSKVKSLKTHTNARENKILITTENELDMVKVELNKNGEIFVNDNKVAAI